MNHFCIILSIMTVSLHAAYYIAPSGNDASGTGTISQPWYSLAKAVTAADPSDTILVRGGTYSYSATISITKKEIVREISTCRIGPTFLKIV